MKAVRKLKIHAKFRSRTGYYVCIPEIRISGKWLQELGFSHGQKVCVEQTPKKLILTLEEEKQDSSKKS